MIQGYEEPFYSIGPNFVLSKFVSQNNVKVVLNGLGGDELFAGYGYYRFCNLPRIPKLDSIARHLESLSNRKIARALRMLSARTSDERHSLLFCQETDAQLRRLLVSAFQPAGDTPSLLNALYADGMEFADGLEAFSYMDMMNYIGNHHVHRIDQFTMAFSIEGRFPFLDHKVVEAAYQIPSRLKFRKGEQKVVLRRVAERYIAAECLSMKKKGFSLPLRQWMNGPLKPIVDSCLIKLQERPEVQRATISEWRTQYAEGRLPSTRIWHLVALELWFEQFIDSRLETYDRLASAPLIAPLIH
jgi:asparagine synthase (glutamine-hydrolysing)